MAGEAFLVLPPFTESNCIIFGRNSFTEENQEVIYLPANPDGDDSEKVISWPLIFYFMVFDLSVIFFH